MTILRLSLSVAVQKMARSDRGVSGVMFTIDTESGFKDMVLINAAWGLGEFVVKGVVTPDEFKVFKPTLKKGFKSIISKRLGSKEKKLIYASEGTGARPKKLPVADADRHSFTLTDEQILKLAKWGANYRRALPAAQWTWNGRLTAMTKELFIVQARPETVQARKDVKVLEEFVIEGQRQSYLPGRGRGRENRPGQGALY